MIRLSCQCGKSLSVKPELAGRKVKCPQCATVLVVPTPHTPEPAAGGDPFNFDEVAAKPRQPGIGEARALVRYWKKENGGATGIDPNVPPEVIARLPEKMQKLAAPEGICRSGAVPGAATALGPLFCGPLLLGAVLTAGFCLGVEELSEDYFWVGILAIFVAIGAIVGWVYFAKAAKRYREKALLLYADRLVTLDADGAAQYRWKDMQTIELRPENRDVGTGEVFVGHQFIITMKDEERIVLRMEYFGLPELGLTIMERAAEHGAECTGRAQLKN